MAASPPSTSALCSLEAMLNSLMERPEGGDDTPRDSALISPAPPLPVRPAPQGRRRSLPRVVRATAPWTPPPSPRKEDVVAGAEDPVLVEEIERRAMEAEAQLRQKEEENAEMRRQIESYHVRWLEYEIKINSLEETSAEQMASLQMARDAAGTAGETPPYDRRHESPESHMKMSEEASATLRRGVGAWRSTVARRGAEFQALENGAAVLVEPMPWQPGVPSANSIDDLKKLKSQFRAWKKDYKARLRRTKAELDRDRRRRGSCWI